MKFTRSKTKKKDPPAPTVPRRQVASAAKEKPKAPPKPKPAPPPADPRLEAIALFPAELIGGAVVVEVAKLEGGQAFPVGAKATVYEPSRRVLDGHRLKLNDGRDLYCDVAGTVTREGGIPQTMNVNVGGRIGVRTHVVPTDDFGRRFVTWDPETKTEYYLDPQANNMRVDLTEPKEA